MQFNEIDAHSLHSGMLAADAAYEALTSETAASAPITLDSYEPTLRNSWVGKELYEVRNIRPSFHNPLGLYGGVLYSGIDTILLKGRVPFTFNHPKPDWATLKKKSEVKEIEYPKPDGVISFDLLESVSRTGTGHGEDQPVHLKLERGPGDQVGRNWEEFGGPEQKFCPGRFWLCLLDREFVRGVVLIVE